MKLAIMQPYFLPYIGYISLVKHTDRFVLFDTVQFIRHGWIERNRVLKDSGWQYIKVPLQKHSLNTKIQEIKINNVENWRDKIFAQLQYYKRIAPYYAETIEVIKKGMAEKTDSITKLNYCMLQSVCKYLHISFNCSIFSEMDINIEAANEPDEWALNICKAMGYDEYWNPPNGKSFFDPAKYVKAGIKLVFLEQVLSVYPQGKGRANFEPGLSIVDVMMFNPVEAVNAMLDDYRIS